jgi:hypothetical protein
VADNYLQFSEVITHLTPDEETWLQQQFEVIHVFGDREYLEGELPEGLSLDDADWSGVRAWRNLDDIEYPDETGFGHEFDDGDEWNDWGRYLWLYAEEDGDPERVARFVQMFVRRFRPDQCWSLTYAVTCSKLRVGEFSGGAYFITADEVKWENAYRFVEDQQKAFAGKAKDAK